VGRPPEEALALLMLALLILAVGVGSCTRAARRAGLSLREWLDTLR
jgi:hypothetical protein